MTLKGIKWNDSFFRNLPKEYYDHLVNYPEALPEGIYNTLRSCTPNFKEDMYNRFEDEEVAGWYAKQRVEYHELSVTDAIKKKFEDEMDFIKKYPEYLPMIKEVITV